MVRHTPHTFNRDMYLLKAIHITCIMCACKDMLPSTTNPEFSVDVFRAAPAPHTCATVSTSSVLLRMLICLGVQGLEKASDRMSSSSYSSHSAHT